MESIEREVELDTQEELDITDYVSDETQAFLESVMLKQQLIVGDIPRLKATYEEQEDYEIFLDILAYILEHEPAFFLAAPDAMHKAEEVLYAKRFDYCKILNYNEVINYIIGVFNGLKNMSESDKNYRAHSYKNWNLSVRGIGQNASFTELLTLMDADAALLACYMEGNVSELASGYFFSSTNYFIEMAPEIFERYYQAQELTEERLNTSAALKGFWNRGERAFAKQTIAALQKIKTSKEE